MTTIEQSYRADRIAPRTRWQLIVLAAGLFIVGTNAFVIAGVLPEIAAELHTTVASVSYTITWYSIVVAVASPLIASLLPRLSRTVLMASGLGIVAVGTLVTTIAPTLGVFELGRVIAAVGGAALVPAATAAASGLVPDALRGRALATVGAGFTLATALGAPVGTALAAAADWRLPLGCLAALAAVVAVAIAVTVRGVPTHAGLRFGQRFSVFADWRIGLMLIVQILLTAAFNIVYIFSSSVMRAATHGSGTVLAVLLLVYGLGGVVGKGLGGLLADRLGALRTGVAAMTLQAVVFVLIALFGSNLVAGGILFAAWGVVAFAALVPLQHRVVALNPPLAGISLSWLSTAMYVGIACAPLLGAVALKAGPTAVLLTASVLTVAGAVVMLVTLAGPRAGAPGSVTRGAAEVGGSV